MFASLLSVALGLLGAETELSPGLELHYRGTVAPMERGSVVGDPQKSFDLTIVVTRADEAGTEYLWLIDERGSGGFGWTDRAGRASLNADGAAVGTAGPALLFDYGEGKQAVPLSSPRFVLPRPQEVGLLWQAGGLEHEIMRTATVDDRKAWEVESRNQFGRQRVAWVDADTHLLLKYDARVFMNQGTEYQLKVEQLGAARRDAAAVQSLGDGIAALDKLRTALKRQPRTPDAELSAEQVAKLAELLPTAKSAAADEALARIIAAAERDLQRQAERTSALDQMTAKQAGRKVDPFVVRGDGELQLSADDLRDRVTVLHFWDYRDKPLTEPYGQVGYLEFLYDRRREAGVKVYGVAVDGRFRDAETAGAAAAGVRRLKNFMNLTYPVVYDGGELIRQFGDPRTAGGSLPLFVVINRTGAVAEYHVGHYEVDREAGLKQLDLLVEKLLAEKPAK